jgi:hypothetical protein
LWRAFTDLSEWRIFMVLLDKKPRPGRGEFRMRAENRDLDVARQPLDEGEFDGNPPMI